MQKSRIKPVTPAPLRPVTADQLRRTTGGDPVMYNTDGTPVARYH